MQGPYGQVRVHPYGATVDHLAYEQDLKRVRAMEKREQNERRRRQKRRRARVKSARKTNRRGS